MSGELLYLLVLCLPLIPAVLIISGMYIFIRLTGWGKNLVLIPTNDEGA